MKQLIISKQKEIKKGIQTEKLEFVCISDHKGIYVSYKKNSIYAQKIYM